MKKITIDLNVTPKETLSTFPVIKTIQPEEFSTWYTKYITPNEIIVGIINDVVICTNRAIAYALPLGCRFNYDDANRSISIVSDSSIKYTAFSENTNWKNKEKYNFLCETNSYKLLTQGNILTLYPLVDDFEFGVIWPNGMGRDYDGVSRTLERNYDKLWKLGYKVYPNFLNLTEKTISEWSISRICCEDVEKLSLNIDDLLKSNLIPNEPKVEQSINSNRNFVLSPTGFPNVNHCNCGHDHNQCSADNNITVSSIVNNLSAIENAANVPENRLNNLIINSIRQAGFDCTIEPRQSGLFNINIINNGALDINRSFVADLNGLVVDPRPKYFPFIKPNTYPIDQDLFINYTDIGNVFNNENGEYIADQDIKDLMLNNTVNARSRCYSDEDAKLLTMVNTLSITNKNIDNNTKISILKSILKALKNTNLMAEINKYQDMPMFVLTGMKSNTNFTIRSDMSAGKLSTKAIIIDFDLTKSTDGISFYTE